MYQISDKSVHRELGKGVSDATFEGKKCQPKLQIRTLEIKEEDNTADYEPPSPSPDPMAGIGYWESPGNSPKPARKCMTGEGDHVDPEEDFAHQRSRDGIIVDLTSGVRDLLIQNWFLVGVAGRQC